MRAWLTEEVRRRRSAVDGLVRDQRRANGRYHKDDPLGQAEIKRITDELQVALQRLSTIEGFDRDWSRFEPTFAAFAAEAAKVTSGGRTVRLKGLLLGHETVKAPDGSNAHPHRYVAHINVEGTRVVSGDHVKVVIYILP